MQADSMVIFTRTYDFISWLIPKTMSFPRSQRFVVTQRLQDAALSFQEYLIEANRNNPNNRNDNIGFRVVVSHNSQRALSEMPYG